MEADKLTRREFLKLAALSAGAAAVNWAGQKLGLDDAPGTIQAAKQPQDDSVSVHHKPGIVYVGK